MTNNRIARAVFAGMALALLAVSFQASNTHASAATSAGSSSGFASPLSVSDALIQAPAVQLCPSSVNITEFRSAGNGYGFSGITLGPDGNIWFTADYPLNQPYLGSITRGGNFSEFRIPDGKVPQEITTGKDGNLWFTLSETDQIGKSDTQGHMTIYTIPNPENPRRYPVGITWGLDGNVWFAESFSSGIANFNPITLLFTEFPLSPGKDPSRIVWGPDNALEFTEYVGGNAIGRMTVTGKVKEIPMPNPNSNPLGITVGPDKALYFTEYNGNRIGRIDSTGKIKESSILPTPSSDPTGISWDHYGNFWFTEQGGRNIGCINPQGKMKEYPTPTPSSNPVEITPGSDGNMWFTEWAGGSGHTIGRVTIP